MGTTEAAAAPPVAHYSISIVRDRGIDTNALDHILARGHAPQALAFVGRQQRRNKGGEVGEGAGGERRLPNANGFGQCLLKLNVYSPANKNSAGMLREHTF